MANYAAEVRNLGAELIGGCCGTIDAHLHAMNHELETQLYQPTNLEIIPQRDEKPKSSRQRRRRKSS